MMSDLQFGINALQTEGTSAIGVAALLWLRIICLVNLYLYRTSKSETRNWIDRDHEVTNRLTYSVLDVLTTNIELLSLQPWKKGVPLDDGIPTHSDFAKWVTYAGHLEDIPQIILQVGFVILHGRLEEYVILAFIATVFCLRSGAFTSPSPGQRKTQVFSSRTRRTARQSPGAMAGRNSSK